MANTKQPKTEVAQGETIEAPNGQVDDFDATYVPKTDLGRRLMEIRKRIVASGQPLLSWEELEREIDERRGCHCADE
jgi:hypothetical protein